MNFNAIKLGGFLLLICLTYISSAQSVSDAIKSVEGQRDALEKQLDALDTKIVDLKQKQIIEQMKEIGLPSDNFIEHLAMILAYSETDEQAKWVAHMIVPDIATGAAYRSNDFRADPKIETGTAVQEDYFLTDTLANGEVKYDGFGYDRGHLAPSADFRWSADALSVSYYYSNMSPQLPEFNREKWAELENHLRRYVINNGVPLYIVTMPILEDGLTKIERSINAVSIPKRFAKAAYDPVNRRAIGFIMENKQLDYPIDTYAVDIDNLEEATGLNIFSNLEEEFESLLQKEFWFENLDGGDKEPLSSKILPGNAINTIQAQHKVGKMVQVCGHVVASRYSRKGHLWLNLDRQFPNQIFSIFIKKENLANFEYDLKERFINQNICVKGKVEDFTDTPSITLKSQSKIDLFEINNLEN